MNIIKITFIVLFISTTPILSQTYEEILKLREEYQKLEDNKISNEEINSDDKDLNNSENQSLTRIIYKPEDLDEFYRIQLSQLSKSLDDLMKINSFFDSTKQLSHFGYEIFLNRDSISFYDNIPSPSNYTLGSGDQIVVSLWGEVEKEETALINRDGNIFLEDIGILSLTGITLEQAKNKIINSYSKTYSTIKGNKPSTFVDISLGDLKDLNVHILGFVKSPGLYALHPFTDPFTALFYSGGIDTTGTLRNIDIIRNGNVINTIDLYDILHGNSIKSQIRLLDQDIIFVPSRESKVLVNGEVLIPGYYELIDNESALDLINYSGGLTPKASTISILKRINSPLTRKNDDLAIEFFLIPIDSLNTFSMNNGDSLGIGIISDYYPTITINGWVKRPGKYPFVKGMKLIDLIELGGGLYDENWLFGSQNQSVSLIKFGKDGNRTNLILDYKKIFNGQQNLELNAYDQIQIAKSIFNDFNKYVELTGEVQSEGVYNISNRTLNEIIKDAGGFTPTAFIEGAQLYRDTLQIGLNNLSIIPLNGDSLNIPTKPESITILGSVNNPGLVTFHEGFSIKDYIEVAGGFTIYANKRDIYVIYPNGIAKRKNRFNSPMVLDGSTIMVSTSQLVVQPTNYLEVSQQIASIIGSLATVALIINTQNQK
jgi:protein involved in polysaccharide export with SLBB domain